MHDRIHLRAACAEANHAAKQPAALVHALEFPGDEPKISLRQGVPFGDHPGGRHMGLQPLDDLLSQPVAQLLLELLQLPSGPIDPENFIGNDKWLNEDSVR